MEQDIKKNLEKIKSEQLELFHDFQKKQLETISPITNSVFFTIKNFDDTFQNKKNTIFKIYIIGDNTDVNYFNSLKNSKNQLNLTLNINSISEKFKLNIFQTEIHFELSKTDIEKNFLKVIKIAKLKLNFNLKSFESNSLINELFSYKKENIFQFPLNEFESINDINFKIINKCLKESEEIKNWKKLGINENVGFSNHQFEEKKILMHSSNINQMNNFIQEKIDLFIKSNNNLYQENLDYFNKKILKGFLDKNMSNNNKTIKKLKI